MIIIGITGGIGSGKSIVCECFKLIGIPVFNSDSVAKNSIETNIKVIEQLRHLLGIDVFDSENRIDKAKMASKIFGDEKLLDKVNKIIHPEVRAAFTDWCLAQKSKYVIQESAIIFETGLYKQFDKTITVVAPINLRIDRITKRDSISIEQINERINKQFTDEQRIKLSDFIIVNNEQQLVFPQVLTIHHEIIKIG